MSSLNVKFVDYKVSSSLFMLLVLINRTRFELTFYHQFYLQLPQKNIKIFIEFWTSDFQFLLVVQLRNIMKKQNLFQIFGLQFFIIVNYIFEREKNEMKDERWE
jgi:hypothetical protein